MTGVPAVHIAAVTLQQAAAPIASAALLIAALALGAAAVVTHLVSRKRRTGR